MPCLCIIIVTEAANMPQTSVTPNGHELHSHQFIGRQWTYQTIYNKTHCTQTHKEANKTPHKTHTSTTLTSNTFHHSLCTTVI